MSKKIISELEILKEKMLDSLPENPSELLVTAINSLNKDPKRPLGKFNVSNWSITATRGCNLRCGHCATRLFERNVYQHMTPETMKHLMELVKIFTPYNRIAIAQAGEPTMNPKLPELLRIGRETSPFTSFQVVTNGVRLINGDITYKDLFENGCNIVYVDMYAPEEKHIELAKKSGYNWYMRRDKTPDQPAAWTYHRDPNLKWIVFQENPANWKNKNNLGNFLNNLDWDAAAKFGIKKTLKAPDRRCNLPFKSAIVDYDGSYSFCCLDFMREVHGDIGFVQEGINGFIDYWFGEYMQTTRNLLYRKDRNGHEICKRCNFIPSRCDIPVWKEEDMTNIYIEDGKTKFVTERPEETWKSNVKNSLKKFM
jgi:hypothetical protein